MSNTSEYDIPIVRIVVNGKPSIKKEPENIERASSMLYGAFTSKTWRGTGKALFALTPGGFVKGKFPANWEGQKGWKSCRDDFEVLVEHALPLVRKVLSREILALAKRRARFLTLGVDLLKRPGSSKLSSMGIDLHVELVCVVDLQIGEVIHWTGKSYPTSSQEHWLVQEVNLESHLFKCSGQRVLILGCHDLNLFSERSKTLAVRDSFKYNRIKEMRKLVKDFSPTIVLHHPHWTDSPNVWPTAWSGICKLLGKNYREYHVRASGIAFLTALEAK